MQHETEHLPNGTLVWVDKQHRFGTDSLLLAEFCDIRVDWSACDLGSGCGILLLALLDKGLKGAAVGVEIQPSASALLAGAAKQNRFTNVEARTVDLKLFKTPYPFDLVISNPPYYSAGPCSPNSHRAVARHDVHCDINQLCATAGRILKDRGRFCVCWPPDRLSSLFAALKQANLEPKKMQLVRKSATSAPWLALLETRKFGGEGLVVLPDRLINAGQPYIY